MFRSAALVVVVVVALTVQPLLAEAQSPPQAVDSGTKLSFGPSMGGATLERSINYAGPPANRPDQGASYFYSTAKHMVITVQVFDNGKRVPTGSANPVVTEQFASEIDAVAQEIKGSGYANLQLPSVPSSCTYGSVSFRCITYSAQTPGNTRLYSKLLMTGYQNHFVKIRIDWGQTLQQAATDAEAALQSFVPALMH